MSLGLEGAFGANEFQKALRQQILDQEAQKQQAFQNSMTVRGADRADRALGQQDTLTRLKIQELADAKASTEADQQFKIGTQLSNTIPAGTVLAPDNPSVKPLQALGAVKEQAPTLPSTSSIGVMQAPTGDGVISGRLVSQTQNAGNPRQFVKLPSQAENVANSNDAFKQQEAQRRLEDATTRADQAWTRLQQGQQTASALDAFRQAQLEVQRAKLEAEQAKATAAAAKTPQPQFFNDAKGNTHAVIFDKGTLTEVPLPAGYTPTKAAAPGFFDKLSHLFSSGDASDAPREIRYDANGRPIS